MRGTDPTKSKWECPIMFYVCCLYNYYSLYYNNYSCRCITKYNFKCLLDKRLMM